jgi:hypothetical protein
VDAFASLSEFEHYLACDALVMTRLALAHANEPMADGEPREVDVDDERVTLVFTDATYVWGRLRRELLEMRPRRCHVDFRAFSEFGRPLVMFQQPLGDPRWN